MATKKPDLKKQSLDILKRQHQQNIADIRSQYSDSMKDLSNTANVNAERSGMVYSTLPGSTITAGQTKLQTEKNRNANLENINYSKLMLDILTQYANQNRGGGGSSKPKVDPTVIPTRNNNGVLTSIQPAGRSPTLPDAVARGIVPIEAARTYTGTRTRRPNSAPTYDTSNYQGGYQYTPATKKGGDRSTQRRY